MTSGRPKRSKVNEIARLQKLIDRKDRVKIKRRADEAHDKKEHEECVRLGPRNRMKKLLTAFVVKERANRGKSPNMPDDIFLVRIEEVSKSLCRTFDLEPSVKKEKDERDE